MTTILLAVHLFFCHLMKYIFTLILIVRPSLYTKNCKVQCQYLKSSRCAHYSRISIQMFWIVEYLRKGFSKSQAPPKNFDESCLESNWIQELFPFLLWLHKVFTSTLRFWASPRYINIFDFRCWSWKTALVVIFQRLVQKICKCVQWSGISY